MTDERAPGWRIAVSGVASALTERLADRFDRPFGDAPAPTAVLVAAGKFVAEESAEDLHRRVVVGVGAALDGLDTESPPRVILVSDAGVLGTSTGIAGVAEDAAPGSGDRFARANLAAERLCADWADAAGAVLVIARLAPLASPTAESRLAEIVAAVRRDGSVPTTFALWSLASPEAVAASVAALAAAPSSRVAGKRFTVVDSAPKSLVTLAGELASAAGLATPRRAGLFQRFRSQGNLRFWDESRVYRGSFPPTP